MNWKTFWDSFILGAYIFFHNDNKEFGGWTDRYIGYNKSTAPCPLPTRQSTRSKIYFIFTTQIETEALIFNLLMMAVRAAGRYVVRHEVRKAQAQCCISIRVGPLKILNLSSISVPAVSEYVYYTRGNLKHCSNSWSKRMQAITYQEHSTTLISKF